MIKDQINPARITLARQSRGLTRAELHKKLGISYLSKLEHGTMLCTRPQAKQLAKATDYPLSFFMAPGIIEYCRGYVYRNDKDPGHASGRNNALINLIRLHLESLTNTLNIQAPVLPKLNINSNDDIPDAVQALRTAWNLQEVPLTNLAALLESKGIAIWYLPFEYKMRSRYTITAEGQILICISSSLSYIDQQYALAYELAHVLLHDFSNSFTNNEARARLFADELLMPINVLQREVNESPTPEALWALAGSWHVSGTHIARMIDEYMLLKMHARSRMRRSLEELAMVNGTTVPDIHTIEPRLIKTWLARLAEEEHLDQNGLAAFLHLHLEDFLIQFDGWHEYQTSSLQFSNYAKVYQVIHCVG